ncbi:MAG: lactate utilization protein [Betaproteobacteria bacterium]
MGIRKMSTWKVLLHNLAARNIEAFVAKDESEARERILNLIPSDATVGFGNSQTLKKLGLAEALAERGNAVYDKTAARSPEEARALKRQSLLADWFVAGINALSEEGHIVNIDHSGNRVAGMLYGPDHVVLVAGRNKVVPKLEEAIQRAREVAAPQNAKRAGLHPPCLEAGHCVDCRSADRVCNSLVVIEGQIDPERMKVIIIDEDLGF